MKTASAKAKGRRLQNKVAEIIRDFTGLTEADVKPAIMGEQGSDIKLSSLAQKVLPFAIECKNSERLNIWAAIEQAENNAGDLLPAVCFKRNHSKIYITMDLVDFMTVLITADWSE